MHDQSYAAALGAAVRARRKEFGLKQVELAELAGVSTRFVHTIEAGKTSARMDKVLDLLHTLGLGFHLRPGPCLTIDKRVGGDRT